MICPVCFGRRIIEGDRQPVPCPECEGHGEIHCCEGLQETPTAAALEEQQRKDRRIATKEPVEKIWRPE